jgi:hypothetical protein
VWLFFFSFGFSGSLWGGGGFRFWGGPFGLVWCGVHPCNHRPVRGVGCFYRVCLHCFGVIGCFGWILLPGSGYRPAGKTRDASDRLLPPETKNCVHPHLARSRLASAAFTAWAPRRVWALRGLTGGPGVSRRPRPLQRIVREASRLSAPGRGGSNRLSLPERGRCLPTAPSRSSL